MTEGGPTGEGESDAADRSGPLARLLVLETREELLKADQKANVVLTVLATAITALAGAVGAGGITPARYGPVAQSLFWAGCAATLPALVLVGLAIMPRMGSAQLRQAHYYGDANRAISMRRLSAAVRRTDPLQRDLSQFAQLSRIVAVKYRCVRRAMLWSGVFLTFVLAGIVVGILE